MAAYTTAYPAAPAAYYTEYLAQPPYEVQPHPYGANYTTTATLLQPDQYERPSSRRTISPASSNDHSDPAKGHRRRRSSSAYLDPATERIIVTGGSPSRRDRDRDQRSRERELQRERDLQLQHDFEKEERRRRRHQERREQEEAEERRERQRQREREAAKADKAKPIPFTRSSTMPTGHTIAPAHETRGRRPIIMAEVYDGAEASARIPIGPVPVIEHASRGRSSGSRRYSTSRGYDMPLTPPSYTSDEEQLHRRASQRSRMDDQVRSSRGQEFPSSAPSSGSAAPISSAAAHEYGSSYGSNNSGFTPPRSPRHRRMSSSGSAAAAAAVKNLRWADQETKEGIKNHNDRINQRPKLGRSESVKLNRPLHGEVKSILKNSANNTSTPPTPTSASRPSSSERPRSSHRRDSIDPEGLSRAMEGLSANDPEFRRRLADRFAARPTRRHSTFGPGPASGVHTDYLGGERVRRY